MEYIYIKTKNSDIKHEIPYCFIKNIILLKECEKNDVIELPIIKKEINDNEYYYINTSLEYISEYFKMWKDDSKSESYINEGPIETGDISSILQEKDINFINKYIKEQYGQIIKNQNLRIDDEKYKTDENYKSKIDISILSILLTQTDEYLGIHSLGNKIYVYISCLLWNKTEYDIRKYVNESKKDM
jgi:hypothetical protein